jgi:hypothetical protein
MTLDFGLPQLGIAVGIEQYLTRRQRPLAVASMAPPSSTSGAR